MFLTLGMFLLALSECAARDGCPDISRVDFANRTYAFYELVADESPGFRELTEQDRRITLALTNGEYRDESSSPSIVAFARIEKVVFGHLAGRNHPKQAAVFIRASSGGTLGWGVVYVFSCEAESLREAGAFLVGYGAYSGLIDLKLDRRTLVMVLSDPQHAVADCCSTATMRLVYAFRAGTFVRVGGVSKATSKGK